jgi:hypothetical protein
MKKLQITALAAGIALACGAVGTASAFTITAGDIKFTIDNYDAGTTGYGNTSGVKCNTVATCDAVAGIVQAPGSSGSEDTWGIFSVAAITNISTGNTLFTRGVDGFLTGIFYGLDDALVEVLCGIATGCTTSAFAVNGSVDMYLNSADYNPDPNNDDDGPGGRIGTNGYKSITDAGGTLYLSANFAKEVNGVALGYTYLTKYDNASLAGNGQGFLDITGGSAASIFDTNTLVDPMGGKHDLFLTVTYDDADGLASANGWTVTSAGQVKAAATPEPGTLALFGVALAAAGALRRRKAG